MQFMQVLTSLVLAAFAGYMGAWYFGAIEGNFASVRGVNQPAQIQQRAFAAA